MSFIKIGGYQWSKDLINWGSRGAYNKASILGYYIDKNERGAPSGAEIKRVTLNFWDVYSVYSLYRGDMLLYVGEGKLGECMRRHHAQDEFVDKWDSFSWLSPFDIQDDGAKVSIVPWDDTASLSIAGKALVETLELVVVRLAEPFGNRQNPTLAKSVKWLDQLPPKNYMTLEEKIDELLARIPKPPTVPRKSKSKKTGKLA